MNTPALGCDKLAANATTIRKLEDQRDKALSRKIKNSDFSEFALGLPSVASAKEGGQGRDRTGDTRIFSPRGFTDFPILSFFTLQLLDNYKDFMINYAHK